MRRSAVDWRDATATVGPHTCVNSCACVMQRGRLPMAAVPAHEFLRVLVTARLASKPFTDPVSFGPVSSSSKRNWRQQLQQQWLTLQQVSAVRQLMDTAVVTGGDGTAVCVTELCCRWSDRLTACGLRAHSTWLLLDARSATSCLLQGVADPQCRQVRLLLRLPLTATLLWAQSWQLQQLLTLALPPGVSCVLVDAPQPARPSPLIFNCCATGSRSAEQLLLQVQLGELPEPAAFTVDSFMVGVDALLLLHRVAGDKPLEPRFFPRALLTLVPMHSCGHQPRHHHHQQQQQQHHRHHQQSTLAEALVDLHAAVLRPGVISRPCRHTIGRHSELLLHYCRLLVLGLAPAVAVLVGSGGGGGSSGGGSGGGGSDWRQRQLFEDDLVNHFLAACSTRSQQRIVLHRFMAVHMSASQAGQQQQQQLQLFLVALLQLVYCCATRLSGADWRRRVALLLRLEIAALITRHTGRHTDTSPHLKRV